MGIRFGQVKAEQEAFTTTSIRTIASAIMYADSVFELIVAEAKLAKHGWKRDQGAPNSSYAIFVNKVYGKAVDAGSVLEELVGIREEQDETAVTQAVEHLFEEVEKLKYRVGNLEQGQK